MNKPPIRHSLMRGIMALLLLIPLGVWAIPQTLSYQGYLTDTSGAPLTGTHSLTFSLYTVSSGGTAQWSETQGTVQVSNGLFTVELGNGAAFPVNLFATPLWLGISVDGDPEMSPRTPLSSGGYAFKAEDADRLEGVSAASLDQSAHVADMGNPHGVTAAQVGAADATALNNHLNDTGNPHGVTAAQAGAVDTTSFTAHTGNPAAHHAPYSDPQAVSAMGAKEDGNSLNHDKYTDAAAVLAIKAADGSGSTLDADQLDGLHASELIDAAQDEVRIPISALPFTISQPGSYYLTGDLTATGTAGITVNADDVTIDLMGYRLIGDGSANIGINLTGRSNVTIRNGTVRGFGDSGIYQGPGTGRSIRVLDVRVLGNGGSGVFLFGSNHLVARCVAGDNGGYGIYAGNSSRLLDNTAYNNAGADGISGGPGSTLTGNTAYNNQQIGIVGSTGASLTGNTIYYNQSWGIFGNGSNTIKDNTIYSNNQSNTSGVGGLRVGSYSQVRGNTLDGNLQNNLYVFSTDNAIEENLVTGSTVGINFVQASGNYWNNNRASGNTTDYVNGAGQNSSPGNVSF